MLMCSPLRRFPLLRENGAKESTSTTVHHDGCAGLWHAGSAELARSTHKQRRMVLGWGWEHLQPPPAAAAASAPRWRLVCCRMKFQSIFLTRASFKLSHILDHYFKWGEHGDKKPRAHVLRDVSYVRVLLHGTDRSHRDACGPSLESRKS